MSSWMQLLMERILLLPAPTHTRVLRLERLLSQQSLHEVGVLVRRLDVIVQLRPVLLQVPRAHRQTRAARKPIGDVQLCGGRARETGVLERYQSDTKETSQKTRQVVATGCFCIFFVQAW